jgi:hypothetical protein
MSYFDKFIKDLDKRTDKKKKARIVSEQEQEYQEKRRLRVDRFQERWQNSTRYTPIPGKKK